MIVVVFAALLAGIVVWMGWLWMRTPAPIWTLLVALLPVGLGVWCLKAMGAAFLSASRVPVTLPTREQVRQVAMHSAWMMRLGMLFLAITFVSAGWLLFVMCRWEASDMSDMNDLSDMK